MGVRGQLYLVVEAGPLKEHLFRSLNGPRGLWWRGLWWGKGRWCPRPPGLFAPPHRLHESLHSVFRHHCFWLYLFLGMVFYAKRAERGVCVKYGFQCLPLFDHGGHCGVYSLNWIPCRRMVFCANVLNQDTQTLRCVRHGILRIVVFLLFHYFYLHVRLVEQNNRSEIQLRKLQHYWRNFLCICLRFCLGRLCNPCLPTIQVRK